MAIEAKEVTELRNQLEQVYRRTIQSRGDAGKLYASAGERDARITGFTKLINTFQPSVLAFTIVTKNLLNPEWWKENFGGIEITADEAQTYADAYMNFFKCGFFTCMFAAVESSLRLFLHAIDSKACNGGRAQFQAVYNCLLKTKLQRKPKAGVELMDLLCSVRSAVMSHGVYLPPSGKDKVVEFGGAKYEFNDGAMVECTNWQFFISRADDVRELLHEVVSDAAMKKITAEIPDPTLTNTDA